jgi:hypothetical protein
MVADEMSGQFAAVSSWFESLKLLLLPTELKQALMILSPANDRVFVQSRLSSDTRAKWGQEEFMPSPTGQYKICAVLRNAELRKKANPNEGASTHRIELDVSCFGNHPYITGDHCTIIPVRSYDEVVCICNSLQVQPSDVVEAVSGRPVLSEATGESKDHVIMSGEIFEIIGPSRSFDFNSKS